MARRTTEETRELLLSIGLRSLHERGVHVAVTHVRLADVAGAAGLTTGAAYRCWPNQEAFHRDLAIAAVEWRDEATIARTLANIATLVDADAPLAEVLRVGAMANVHAYPRDEPFFIAIVLRSCASSDGRLAEAARDRLDTAAASFTSLYEVLLGHYRRRMRPPLTVHHLTVALAALSEGFALQTMAGASHPSVQRDDTEPGVGADWTLMGCAVESIVDRFTEPLDGPAALAETG